MRVPLVRCGVGALRLPILSPTSSILSTTSSTRRSLVNTASIHDWDDRQALQDAFTLAEKQWQVQVYWKSTPYGIGLFAGQDITKGQVLRIGTNGDNLISFQSVQDVDEFCQGSDSKLRYVKDYLWGFYLNADESGYPLNMSQRFFGMWVPGNGLNHCETPNTVYRAREGGTKVGIQLVALSNIQNGDELYDDYRRHGPAPQWLQEWATLHQVSLNFAGSNDFV